MAYQPSFLFNAEAILREDQLWYYLTYDRRSKGVHIFSLDIGPKVNVIARLEFELAQYDFSIQHFNHYITGSPLCWF